ncbi:hypothetical protein BDB00DRAFT_831065 [Zychaea mexicana]|uniref:uncharacterized protein n=1 Tax=Zychaea mexicana TaxID=64656 RepID=UPI0022FE2E1D|nr:uncharacterized protein BDB00DRAFT_831065 [Zychaea mexicana]KAI9491889.1 hypothetical protein BDB00DRAFT_831065 [Zychaea mexicana]
MLYVMSWKERGTYYYLMQKQQKASDVLLCGHQQYSLLHRSTLDNLYDYFVAVHKRIIKI